MARKEAVARAVKKWRGDKRSLTIFFDRDKDADLVEWIEATETPKSVLVKKALRKYKEDKRRG